VYSFFVGLVGAVEKAAEKLAERSNSGEVDPAVAIVACKRNVLVPSLRDYGMLLRNPFPHAEARG
jgi:hypothetical protein